MISSPVSTIAALVLAAGRGRRFGAESKLTVPFRGRPLVRAAVETALASPARPVVVVSGHWRDALEAALDELAIRLVANPDPDLGLGSSLRLGLQALPAGIDGVVVMLGDMPLVTADHIARLIAAFEAHQRTAICVPTCEGARGNPVLWPAWSFPRLAAIEGDRGGRVLLGPLAGSVVEVAMADDGVLIDVDDAAALAAAARVATDAARR